MIAFLNPFLWTDVVIEFMLNFLQDLYHFDHERFQRRKLMRLTWTTKHRCVVIWAFVFVEVCVSPNYREYLPTYSYGVELILIE